MDFGIMFFSATAQAERSTSSYRLLLDAARFADENDFCCVWTPERHFHPFGGLFPNPALTGAALAMITERVQIRAGSLISPLHDTIRIVEEWSVVDNLSGGRVAVAFGSGWNIDDFVFYPEKYASRHATMYQQIEEVRSLWRGEPVSRTNSNGLEVELTLYPSAIQQELPIWVTSSGNLRTFESAGEIGANVLTHLIGQDVEKLAEKISCYREARERSGFDGAGGKVTLMLHTFLGSDVDTVREKVRQPFRDYLRTAVSLEQMAALGGGVISGGHRIDPHDIPEQVMSELLDVTFERYFESAALMGTCRSCEQLIWRLREAGVDEIACLIDFIDDHPAVLESLGFLNDLRKRFSEEALGQAQAALVEQFMNLEAG